MRGKRLHKALVGVFAIALVMSPVALLVLPESVDSTTQLMVKLPAYEKYKCALCHTSATPVAGNSTLNPFGRDFLDNGMVWNAALAIKNSDGDRCSNGFELGDQDGDGVFDAGGTAIEHSNPGDPNDCTIALNRETWGVIKSIFSNEIP